MIKKLLSLISVVAILVTIAVPMVGATYTPAQTVGENGIYTYAYDDFNDYKTGEIMSSDGTTVTKNGELTDSDGKKFTSNWALYMDTTRKGTAEIEAVEEGNNAFKYTITKSSADNNSGISISSANKTEALKDLRDYVVIKARMKNAITTDNALFTGGARFAKLVLGVGDYAYMYGWNDYNANSNKRYDVIMNKGVSWNAEESLGTHRFELSERGNWFDYMLIVSTTPTEAEGSKYAYQIVVDGKVTNVKGEWEYNKSSWASIMDSRRIGDWGSTGVLYIDELGYYGVDADENKLTYTGEWNENNLVLTFSNPATLTKDNISITDSNDETTETVSSVTYADGKFTVAFDGLQAATDYTVTVTGATDVFGHTAETKTFPLSVASEARDIYLTEDGADSTTHEKLKLQPAAAADKVNVVWAQDSTALDADGKTNGAIKATITDKTEETISSSSEITGGQLMNTEWPTGAWGGKRFVTKARLRFGEADGTNAPSQMVFANVVLFSNGAVRRNDSTLWDGTVLAKTSVDGLYEAGKWFDVEAVVDLDVPDQENVDGKTYANVVYKTSFSINGKHIFDTGNQYYQYDDGNVQLHQYQMLVRNIKPVAGADYNCVYVDDISMYAISKEKAEATVLSAADKSVQFKTEHALKDFAAAKLSATVNGNAATISDVAVNNGIYSVILENALAAGDEVVITSNIADVVGNKLTETIKATAGSPTISKLSLNSSGNLRFLTLNSSYTSKDAVLFIATYDGNKLDSIKKIDVTVKPGTNYYKATVSGSYVRTFLFSSVDTLMPLMAE